MLNGRRNAWVDKRTIHWAQEVIGKVMLGFFGLFCFVLKIHTSQLIHVKYLVALASCYPKFLVNLTQVRVIWKKERQVRTSPYYISLSANLGQGHLISERCGKAQLSVGSATTGQGSKRQQAE